MPIGLGPDENNSEPLVNLFYSVPQNRLNSIQNGILESWKNEVLKLDKTFMIKPCTYYIDIDLTLKKSGSPKQFETCLYFK